jgi:hypothetical protein
LAEPELAGFVADVRPSHRRHGGAGALYVYLREIAMKQHFATIEIATKGPGLYAFSDRAVRKFVADSG